MTEFIEDTNKEGDLVRVIWIDIVEADSGWHDKKEIEDLKPSKITSVGYVMKSTSHYLTIAGDKSTDDEDDLNLVKNLSYKKVKMHQYLHRLQVCHQHQH